MSKLSKREVVLLFVLGLVLIIGIGLSVWILPLQSELNALTLQKQSLEQEKMRIEALVSKEGSLTERKQEALEETDALLSKISTRVNPSEFDSFLNQIFSTTGFKVESIAYGDIAPTVPQTVSASEANVEYNLQSLFDQYRDVKVEEGSTEAIVDELLKQTITIDVTGDIGNLPKLIDKVKDVDKTIFVSSISYSKGDATSAITLSLDIYFLD